MSDRKIRENFRGKKYRMVSFFSSVAQAPPIPSPNPLGLIPVILINTLELTSSREQCFPTVCAFMLLVAPSPSGYHPRRPRRRPLLNTPLLPPLQACGLNTAAVMNCAGKLAPCVERGIR